MTTIENKQTILLTGGAGFIGSALVDNLLEKTESLVVNIDKLTYASVPQSLAQASCHSRYRFIQADIADESAVASIFDQYRPQLIFHLAAESHVDRSISSAMPFVQTNVVGTCVLLQECQRLWSGLTDREREQFRFIHISTDEVFGELAHPDDFDDQDARAQARSSRFNEDSPYAPSSPYSASKASSDHFVRAWFRTHGLPTIISNCSNNFGPRQLPEKLIPRIILNACNGQHLPIYGNGKQIRDWLYVQDHIDALTLVAERGVPGQSYSIGADNERCNIEIVELICNLLEQLRPDKPAGLKNYRDLICHVEDRAGHDQRYAIDSSKIFQDLGWQAKTDFFDGLKQTVSWYLDNQAWCDSAVQRLDGGAGVDER